MYSTFELFKDYILWYCIEAMCIRTTTIHERCWPSGDEALHSCEEKRPRTFSMVYILLPKVLIDTQMREKRFYYKNFCR